MTEELINELKQMREVLNSNGICLSRPVLDIKYIQNGSGYKNSLSKVLSNLFPNEFSFNNGIKVKSIEGVLHSFKVNNNKQILYTQYAGFDAYALRATIPNDWRKNHKLYWQGKEYDRFSIEYQELLNSLYYSIYTESPIFNGALYNSKENILFHKNNATQEETVLTADEYLTRLTVLRSFITDDMSIYSPTYKNNERLIRDTLTESIEHFARSKHL